MEPVNKIKHDAAYNAVMAKIDALMAKGSDKVSAKELAEIKRLAIAAQSYEQEKYVIDLPTTLAGMIEMKMYELKLRQKDLAQQLNISTAKLSLIMNGKQKPDVAFLKSVHSQLKIDASFLLEHA